MKKLKKGLRVIFVILLAAFILIQFIRPPKNNGEEVAENLITAKYQIPQHVQEILKVACYDCHSNTTHYPWYFSIQPIAWVVADHITEGKKELNFSTFVTDPVWRQYKKFKEIGKEVKDGDMPIPSYTWLHRDAVLSAAQKLTVENWASNAMKEMELQYPIKSLEKPE